MEESKYSSVKKSEENVEYSYDGIFWLYKEWTRSKFIKTNHKKYKNERRVEYAPYIIYVNVKIECP